MQPAGRGEAFVIGSNILPQLLLLSISQIDSCNFNENDSIIGVLRFDWLGKRFGTNRSEMLHSERRSVSIWYSLSMLYSVWHTILHSVSYEFNIINYSFTQVHEHVKN